LNRIRRRNERDVGLVRVSSMKTKRAGSSPTGGAATGSGAGWGQGRPVAGRDTCSI